MGGCVHGGGHGGPSVLRHCHCYILNVFVHFFEDVAFRPFRDSKSKAWAKVRRPLSVALAYLVVAW